MDAMKMIVVGAKADQLGGYADHNPVKLFIKHELTRIYNSVKPEHVTCDIEQLGVGTWAADAALTASQQLISMSSGTEPPSHWNEKQQALFRKLLQFAPGHKSSPLVREDVAGYDVLVTVGNVHSKYWDFVAAYRAAEKPEMRVDPTLAPPQYRAAAAMEELRSRIPDGLLAAVEKCADELHGIADKLSGADSPLWGKLQHRQRDVLDLAGAIRRVKDRH